MKRRNFPSAVKARRQGALARLKNNPKEGRDPEQNAARIEAETKILTERTA